MYRRVPMSDAGRLEALRAASTKVESAGARESGLSSTILEKLSAFLPQFKLEMEERGTALSNQSEATTQRLEAEEKCRLYVSHFYQVFNLGVARGRYKASDRAYYQLNVSQESVPDLFSEDSLRTWAENIINGDPVRVAAGGTEIVNPAVAEVTEVYNEYVTKLVDQIGKKDNYEKEQRDVDNIRAEADELIRDIWDELEFMYRKDEPSVMRRKAREYGVVYISRPGEPEEEPEPEETAAEQE
jgi:hypothetical protein